jgi:tungstate transport system permease protein
MGYLFAGLKEAIGLILNLNSEILHIVWTSVKLSTISTILASILGTPVGILISRIDFKGKYLFNSILNTLLSLPTVVAGLLVYSLISHQGSLGRFGMLYTSWGIIFGQLILILPIIVALVRNAIYEIDDRMYETAISLGATGFQRFKLLILEARYGIMGAVVAAYGRVIGEVGVSMMIGGNIKGVTRTITTAIALETNKGRFSFGLALGLILLSISFFVNFLIYYFQTGDNK